MFDINFLNKPGLQNETEQSVVSFEPQIEKKDLNDEKQSSNDSVNLDASIKENSTDKVGSKSSGSSTKIITFFGFIVLFLFLLYNDINHHFSRSDSPNIKEFLSNAIYNESDILVTSIDQNLKQTKIVLQSKSNTTLIDFYNSYLLDAGNYSRFFKLNNIFYLEIKTKNNIKKLIDDSSNLKKIVNDNSIGDKVSVYQEFGNLFIEGQYKYIKHIINDIFENDYFINFNFKNSKENSSLVFFNVK